MKQRKTYNRMQNKNSSAFWRIAKPYSGAALWDNTDSEIGAGFMIISNSLCL